MSLTEPTRQLEASGTGTKARPPVAASRVPIGITVGLWVLLAAFLVVGLVLTPPGALKLSTKLALFSAYTIVTPTLFVGIALGVNRFFKTSFAPLNAFTLGVMSTLMLVIFLIGQSS